jgi:ribonuclease P protein component
LEPEESPPAGQTLPKQERIASRRDFLKIYDQGRKEFSRYAVVFGLPNDAGHPRIGITTTRKLGKAHVRNRLRRWVREIYRKGRGPLGLEGRAVDLVVNVKFSATTATFDDFSRDLSRALQRFVS